MLLRGRRVGADSDRGGGGASDEIFVALAVPFRDAVECLEDVGWEPALLEFFSGPGGVFEDVVQDGDDLLVLSVHAHHDPERVKDVGLAIFPFLAGVGFGRDLEWRCRAGTWAKRLKVEG